MTKEKDERRSATSEDIESGTLVVLKPVAAAIGLGAGVASALSLGLGSLSVEFTWTAPNFGAFFGEIKEWQPLLAGVFGFVSVLVGGLMTAREIRLHEAFRLDRERRALAATIQAELEAIKDKFESAIQNLRKTPNEYTDERLISGFSVKFLQITEVNAQRLSLLQADSCRAISRSLTTTQQLPAELAFCSTYERVAAALERVIVVLNFTIKTMDSEFSD